MSTLRTLFASLSIVAAGVIGLSFSTDGFRAFTTETARRLDVSAHPRVVPNVSLQTAEGRTVPFDHLRGRWLLVDFIYARCPTLCSVMGSQFAELQDRMADPIAKDRVALVSISFDLVHDNPGRLAEYQRKSGGRGNGWIAARPVDAAGLAALMRVFGVTAVPDGRDGFVHNSAIAVVDPEGRLVAIRDWEDPHGAGQYVLARLGS